MKIQITIDTEALPPRDYYSGNAQDSAIFAGLRKAAKEITDRLHAEYHEQGHIDRQPAAGITIEHIK